MSAVVVGAPDTPDRPAEGVSVRTTLDAGAGCPHLVQRLARIAPGAAAAGTAEAGGEAWFVAGGSGQLQARGDSHALAPGMGVWLPAGTRYEAECEGAPYLALVVVVAPEGEWGSGARPVASRLEDREVSWTGDRRFRVLLGPDLGCPAVTQFVGEIPPGRASAHTHTYDEVVHVLSGRGVVHLDDMDQPLAPGSSIYLPPHEPHCLENTGSELLTVLGAFYPPGSPASKTQVADR